MISLIQELVQKYNSKSFHRLVHSRPELRKFLDNWNNTRNCRNINEQFYCITRNIEPSKCDCGENLLFNTFEKGYWNTCGSKKCKSASQAENLSNFWKTHPEAVQQMVEHRMENMEETYGEGVTNAAQIPERVEEFERRKTERELIRRACSEKYKRGKERLKQEKIQKVIDNRIKTRRQYSSKYQREINEIRPYTYLLKFKPTGQVYYGVRTKNIKLGLTPLQDFMFNYTTSSKQINKLIKEYGIESFEYEIRRTFDTIPQADYWEQSVLRRCHVVNDSRWINLNAAGRKSPGPGGLERIRKANSKPKSEETKKKMSAAQKGVPKSEKAKENMSIAHAKNPRCGADNPNFGTHKTPEQKLAQSLKMKGRSSNISAEARQRLSNRMKSDANPGKNKSPETIQKISTALSSENNPNRGRCRSEVTKQKIREALKNKPKSDEARANMSLAQKGKLHPGTGPKGERCAKAKLTESQVLEIRSRYIKGVTTYKSFANEFGVSDVIIYYIISRKTWKHI
jgi:hypothetical protein